MFLIMRNLEIKSRNHGFAIPTFIHLTYTDLKEKLICLYKIFSPLDQNQVPIPNLLLGVKL